MVSIVAYPQKRQGRTKPRYRLGKKKADKTAPLAGQIKKLLSRVRELEREVTRLNILVRKLVSMQDEELFLGSEVISLGA